MSGNHASDEALQAHNNSKIPWSLIFPMDDGMHYRIKYETKGKYS